MFVKAPLMGSPFAVVVAFGDEHAAAKNVLQQPRRACGLDDVANAKGGADGRWVKESVCLDAAGNGGVYDV